MANTRTQAMILINNLKIKYKNDSIVEELDNIIKNVYFIDKQKAVKSAMSYQQNNKEKHNETVKRYRTRQKNLTSVK